MFLIIKFLRKFYQAIQKILTYSIIANYDQLNKLIYIPEYLYLPIQDYSLVGVDPVCIATQYIWITQLTRTQVSTVIKKKKK